jgi:TolB-like protein
LKKQSHNLKRIILPLVASLILLMSLPAHAAPIRVAILPFDVHAEKDMTFLQEGILDMLGSRLAWRDNVDVINKNQTREALASTEGFDGESRALLVGGKLQADYVLFGSLTVFGESVSIDARMVDVSGQQQPVPFFAQTRGMGEVIPQINQFATTINESVFGRAVARGPIAAVPVPQLGVGQATPVQPAQPAYDSRMHPEKLLRSGVPAEDQVAVSGQSYQTPNPGFIATAPASGGASRSNYWKSRNYDAVISAMDIGDTDGDGALETVVAADNTLIVYRTIQGRMIQVKELTDTRDGIYLGVDIADINGNGTPEIFISSMSLQKDRYNSFVMEYDGSEYKRIVDNQPRLYRVCRTSIGQEILMGQTKPIEDYDLFSRPVFQMVWKDGTYAAENQVIRGRRANVMGIAYNDVMQEGQDKLVAYSPDDRIWIYDRTGDTAWEGDDKHGGNMEYFHLPTKDTSDLHKIQYFPMRIRTADIDGDGKTEIIAASNKDVIGVLAKFRQFNSGYLLSLSWNGMSLMQNWKTPEIKGRISDFAIADFDNDGQKELVATVVVKEGRVAMSDKKSFIVAYDLNEPTPQ